MRLKELIDTLDGSGTQAVLYDHIAPYRNLLRAYFTAHYTSTPVIVAVAVFNAAQYCIIAPENEIWDAIVAYDEEVIDNQDLMEQYSCNVSNL